MRHNYSWCEMSRSFLGLLANDSTELMRYCLCLCRQHGQTDARMNAKYNRTTTEQRNQFKRRLRKV